MWPSHTSTPALPHSHAEVAFLTPPRSPMSGQLGCIPHLHLLRCWTDVPPGQRLTLVENEEDGVMVHTAVNLMSFLPHLTDGAAEAQDTSEQRAQGHPQSKRARPAAPGVAPRTCLTALPHVPSMAYREVASGCHSSRVLNGSGPAGQPALPVRSLHR